jgi:hypothetical protein
MDAAIRVALDLPTVSDSDWGLVKQADNFALLVEAQHLMPSRGHWDFEFDNHPHRGQEGIPRVIRTPPYWRGEIDWKAARDEFLARHKELT